MRARKLKPNDLHQRHVARAKHGWHTRRKNYARMQQLWENDMTKATKLALNGDVGTTIPSMEEIGYFTKPILSRAFLISQIHFFSFSRWKSFHKKY